jgi:hypothetical protein
MDTTAHSGFLGLGGHVGHGPGKVTLLSLLLLFLNRTRKQSDRCSDGTRRGRIGTDISPSEVW